MNRILEKLGDNHIDPIVFENINPPLGLYTYEGSVYCLRNGYDFDFDDLDSETIDTILNEFEKSNYVINESFQG